MQERRSAERFRANLKVRWQSLMTQGRGAVCDLSASGCFVLTGGQVTPRELIRLELIEGDEVTTLWGQVAYRVNEMGFALRFRKRNGPPSSQFGDRRAAAKLIANSVLTLLRNARVVCPTRVIESASLLIEDERIAQIVESSGESIEADAVIELNDLTLLPGFIDIHIHGAAGIDTMAASAADFARAGEFLARHGVTSWLPTLVPAELEQYQQAVSAIGETIRNQQEVFAPAALNADRTSAGPDGGARVLGVH